MACIVCNHTMQSVGRNTNGLRQHWCSRCGTIKTENGNHECWESPRWIQLMLDAQWHEVKEGMLSAQRMQKSLSELKDAELGPRQQQVGNG